MRYTTPKTYSLSMSMAHGQCRSGTTAGGEPCITGTYPGFQVECTTGFSARNECSTGSYFGPGSICNTGGGPQK